VMSTWLDEYYIQKVQELVDSGEYNNPSEILREALRQWFMQRERRVVEYRRKIHPDELEQQSGP
jgi:Arc/MetJ-type ribon-helix-helix transcriptional regulator